MVLLASVTQLLLCWINFAPFTATEVIPTPPTCGEIYGHPHLPDCHHLLAMIAANDPKTATAPRFFAQEDLSSGPDSSWPGVDNIFGPARRVAQLPKTFTYRDCHLFLMGIARSDTGYGTGISSWAAVNRVALELATECTEKKGIGGRQYVISKLYHHPLMILFLFGNGAKFEGALNAVMNDPEEFSGKLSALATNTSVNFAGADFLTVSVPSGNGTNEEILEL